MVTTKTNQTQNTTIIKTREKEKEKTIGVRKKELNWSWSKQNKTKRPLIQCHIKWLKALVK